MSRVVACRLSEDEFRALCSACGRNMVSPQDFFRAIIRDALIDEGDYDVRCGKQEGCESASETSEAGGSTAP